MTLDDWMTLSGVDAAELAKQTAVSLTALSRYRRGVRVPTPKVMLRIVQATRGAVVPNDFYAAEISKLKREWAAPRSGRPSKAG